MVPLAQEGNPPFSVSFSSAWQMLGPFQIGTREATWGADPLEFFGGFRNLQYDQEARFRSSLAISGTVGWSLLEGETVNSNAFGSSVSLAVNFGTAGVPLQSIYGWAALQYQAWARGQFSTDTEQDWPLIVYSDSILEFWIDGVHYFGGDFYSFRKAPPVIRLGPGEHTIDVRLVYDVRVGEANFNIAIELASGSLEVVSKGIVMADVLDGSLASSLASVTVRNNKAQDLEILSVEPALNDSATTVMRKSSVVISAGQTRPILFDVTLGDPSTPSIGIRIQYRQVKPASFPSFLEVSQTLTHRSIYEPHKITYLHPGSILSYAMLRPPSKKAIQGSNKISTFPILLGLHGAGVEADNDMVAHALDPVPDLKTWVLFPTGVTPWSGDDWHNWGFADVEAAVNYIPKWVEAVEWQGPGADIDRWLVMGHSNGGQGAWYTLTHRPSKVIAAAALSGYSSIQNYAPYVLWQPMDPQRSAIRDGTLNSYRHELLMENCKGIPILQQHGALDDNVPTYHSRLLSQLLLQANGTSRYYELPDKGHWFDGIMTTPPLIDFYNEQTGKTLGDQELQSFSLVVGSPADTGSKGGFRVTQLETPGQYGKVDVVFDEATATYRVTTSNVLSLEVDDRRFPSGLFLIIDGQDYHELGGPLRLQEDKVDLWRATDGQWKVDNKQPNLLLRSGRQLGAMDAILRTSGHFSIRYQRSEASGIALQISRNLYQYFSADAAIVETRKQTDHAPGNVITVGIGGDVHAGAHPFFPIELSSSGLSIREPGGRMREHGGGGGLSAIFLRPLPDERLELVVWGVNKASLAVAARLVPMLTGVGQPDFVVMRQDCLWKGVEGAVAMGFFDHEWNVTKTAVLR
ncbi:uncharacterized protein BDZ99DRAFT_508319 [Mytilinidion resinicola]|uniref:Peptidase S9 prolyl oligopeptidase catalytic domain-containing protein n=1 Tax=Mytilinidion resinicola TaxID=574789 RepID=A0A6A6YQ62_9PEZI|nr:uncharacterized protein BDZ99DRAFT_508319 [Mytilinidion resinicola]KAF2810891.1 hypothetical protein BDZ99DRAFT_508319 [Mytilinidion resinicola]